MFFQLSHGLAYLRCTAVYTIIMWYYYVWLLAVGYFQIYVHIYTYSYFILPCMYKRVCIIFYFLSFLPFILYHHRCTAPCVCVCTCMLFFVFFTFDSQTGGAFTTNLILFICGCLCFSVSNQIVYVDASCALFLNLLTMNRTYTLYREHNADYRLHTQYTSPYTSEANKNIQANC